jgi:hypothetical protein
MQLERAIGDFHKSAKNILRYLKSVHEILNSGSDYPHLSHIIYFTQTTLERFEKRQLSSFLPSRVIELSESTRLLMTAFEQLPKPETEGFTTSISPITNEQKEQLDKAFDSFVNAADYFIKVSAITVIDKENADIELSDLYESFNVKYQEIESRANEIVRLHSETVKNAQNTKIASEEVAIAHYGNQFGKRAKIHVITAYVWLAIVTVFLIIIIELALSTLNEKHTINSNYDLIIYLGTRAIIFSTVFVALSFSIKNFKINMHNSISNTHRQEALNTFETFIRTAKDDAVTKNAVLIEVCRTIFSPQNSGYSASDNDYEGPSKIIEVIKSISSSKPGA